MISFAAKQKRHMVRTVKLQLYTRPRKRRDMHRILTLRILPSFAAEVSELSEVGRPATTGCAVSWT